MEKPVISIALCTFNGEKYIEEQLNSLLIQDYQPLEIIIIDDCSTDKTYVLLEQYQEKHPQIILYRNKKNIGFNRNFEKALSYCSGSYIAISDQDDIWASDKISIQYNTIKDNLLIYHDSLMMNENGKTTGKRISDDHRFVSGHCAPYLLFNNSISGHTCFFKKELLSHTFPLPEDMYYDWWMAYTAATLGKLAFIEKPLVKHRRHQSNATKNDKINDRERRIRNLLLFKEHPLTTEDTKAFIIKLLKGYGDLKTQNFSFQLFLLFIQNSYLIFYTRKKSNFSKVKFILQECIGHR